MGSLSIGFGSLHFELTSASDIRDALLASFVDEAYARGPFVMVNRESAQPAWLWLADVMHARTDWWSSVGLALQHAAHDGGDRERVALTDFLANANVSAVLLEWTEPLAQRWPDAKSTQSATGWGGGPSARLADVIRDQKKYIASVATNERSVVIGDAAKMRGLPLSNEEDLYRVLTTTAKLGDRDGIAWQWLKDEIWLRPWVAPALPTVFEKMISEAEVAAMLEWLSDGHDLWRFVPLLEGLIAAAPAWLSTPASTKPKSWRHPIRAAKGDPKQKFSDVVAWLLHRARADVACRPNPNLPARP